MTVIKTARGRAAPEDPDRNLTSVLLYLPLHTHPPTLNRPLPDAEHPPIGPASSSTNPDTDIKFLASSHTSLQSLA